MFKLSCIAACVLVAGLAASASAQTITVIQDNTTPYTIDVLLDSPIPVVQGDITLDFSSFYFPSPPVQSTTSGPLVTANGGSLTFTSGTFFSFGTNTEKLDLVFPAPGVSTFIGSDDLLAQLRVEPTFFFEGSILFSPSNINLFDAQNNRINFMANSLVLHMAAVPEPGVSTFALVLGSGMFAWGIHRKRVR